MIPKMIHYCWFGNAQKSEKIKFCMETWQKILPDYQLREWTDKDIPQFTNNYVRQAYETKKWAFVSDVCRLYALSSEGGIYLDTDVEVCQPFDTFLKHDFFIGWEQHKNHANIGTAVIGSEPNNQIIKEMLDLYKDINFTKSDGTFDLTPNPRRLSTILEKYGVASVEENYNYKEPFFINEKSVVYPAEYFCYKNPKSYAIHHFETSWLDAWICKKKSKISLGKNHNLAFYKFKNMKKQPFEYSSSIVAKIFDFNYRKNKYLWVIELKKDDTTCFHQITI
jgi:mannosyltransferase OCH1-like enzyme